MKLMNVYSVIALSGLFSIASYGMYAKIDKVCSADGEKARLECVEKIGDNPLCQQEADKVRDKCNAEFLHGKRKLTSRE